MMVKVQITYNPYTVKTDIKMNGKALDRETSPLMYVKNKRLQEWMEPRGRWAGIYKELKSSTGDSKIEIEFTGTNEDYRDLEYARDKYGSCFTQINLIHKNRDSAGAIDPHQKMQRISKLYQELMAGPIDELKTADIRKNFDTALNSEFRIVIVAPMSSGKSTLINAILGSDLLPSAHQATTAVITEIKVNNQKEDFRVTAYDKYGSMVVRDVKASGKLISELNAKKDPEDSEGKRSFIHRIQIEGPVPNLPSDTLNLVFVDTPGGTYALNSEHEERMDEAIKDENNSLILYVFDGTLLGTNDSNSVLQKIANTMQNSVNGKQSRDRFLFVANQMDEFDLEKESYEGVIDTILEQLRRNGITEPNLFLASAKTARLIRMKRNGEKLSETEEDDLEYLIKKMNRPSRALSRYASLNAEDQERLKTEAERRRAESEKSKDAGIIERNKIRIAEINSGIPAVEFGMREYLEKYAAAIKIKRMHDTFMKKVNERRMIDRCEAEWSGSKESFEGVKAEIADKRKKCDHARMMKEFRAKVEKIRLDTKPVEAEQAKIIREIGRLAEDVKDKVKRDEARYIYKQFRHSLEKTGESIVMNLDRVFEQEIRKSCEDIVSEYREYIQELELEGVLDIGGYKIKETTAFAAFDISKADDLLLDDYTMSEKVKVGSHKKKRKGFLGWVARLFGMDYGFEEVDDFETQKYVKLKNLIQNQVTQIQHSFDKEMKEVLKATEEKVEEIKTATMKKLEDLDKMIENLMNEIDQMLISQDKLADKVKKNADKAQWIRDFVQQVENLLMV